MEIRSALNTQLVSAQMLRKRFFVTDEDLRVLAGFGAKTKERVPDLVDAFYDWLRPQPEFEEFLSDDATHRRVKGLQVGYWADFFSGAVDDAYVANRLRVGETHARIGLSLDMYFAAMNFVQAWIDDLVLNQGDDADRMAITRAVSRLIHLDTAVVVQAYARSVADALAAQSKSLMEMSTPVTQLWEGILMLPLVGIIDSKRAQDIMNAMLLKVAETQSRNFVLDISGVGVVDTAVANHLIKITKATALMGCHTIISGISPAIAQTVVELGIEVGTVETTGTMKDALQIAFDNLGLRLVGEEVASA
jgi:rsbT co-antagonist protein RsbR